MLIGREAEMHAIARLVAAARVGHSSALVLTGEAGIGKTTLLEQAVDLAQGMHVLRAAGSEPEKDVAFAGLLQLLRPVLSTLDKIPSPQVEALSVALALREGRVGDRFAVGAATLSLLGRAAEESPLLLLVDDAHELDRSSAEALAFVGRRLMADRVGLLVSSRPDPGSPLLHADLPQLQVDGLSLTAVAALMSQQAQGTVAPELAERLHRATAGNPLAVVELADDIDALDRLSPQTPLPVPVSLRRAFSRRIAHLGQSARTVLLLAAVADGDLGVVSAAVDALQVHISDLDPAEDARVVQISPGHVAFRHPLMRASVYAMAPPALRRRAHAAVAAALPEADVERRAWNLCEATVGVDDEVADHVDLVGRRALDRSVAAMHALEVLAETGPAVTPRGAQLCDWLRECSLPDGGLPFALPIADARGCAPFWLAADPTASSLQITSQVAANAHRVGRHDPAVAGHPWLAAATTFCIEAIRAITAAPHAYELCFAVQFLDALAPSMPGASDLLDTLRPTSWRGRCPSPTAPRTRPCTRWTSP